MWGGRDGTRHPAGSFGRRIPCAKESSTAPRPRRSPFPPLCPAPRSAPPEAATHRKCRGSRAQGLSPGRMNQAGGEGLSPPGPRNRLAPQTRKGQARLPHARLPACLPAPAGMNGGAGAQRCMMQPGSNAAPGAAGRGSRAGLGVPGRAALTERGNLRVHRQTQRHRCAATATGSLGRQKRKGEAQDARRLS